MATSGQAPARAYGSSMALRFVVLLGIVSLFADITYEGAKSTIGPYLITLGASATAVGVVAGLGELGGYTLRLASGYLADRTRQYWFLTGIGYVVNLLAVPFLALAGRWQVAGALVVVERVGKAIRTPARDVILSYASRQVGRGKAFGIHEALDQIGAVAGPLMFAAVLFSGQSYRVGFALLAIPAVLSLTTLAAARMRFSNPAQFEGASPAPQAPSGLMKLPTSYWLYVAFTAVTTLGLVTFPLVAFHIKSQNLMPDGVIPLTFAAAMGLDALVALAAGRLYDSKGMVVLLTLPAGSAVAALLAFSSVAWAVWLGVLAWGAAMGVQESIMRAAVADLAPVQVRGRAYGVFNAAFGIAWFAGSALMGLLYESSAFYLVLLAVLAQIASIPILVATLRSTRKASVVTRG